MDQNALPVSFSRNFDPNGSKRAQDILRATLIQMDQNALRIFYAQL
jgi:hypothetical protein